MINKRLIEQKFKKIGAKVKFHPFEIKRHFNSAIPLTVDVKTVNGKEEFEIGYNEKTQFELAVIDVCPEEKHLLLMLTQPIKDKVGNIKSHSKLKLLCGHDERHYFSCGIPENAGASTVKEAKKALLPPEFIEAHKEKKGKNRNLLKRKNETGCRQGEWLFVREEDFEPDDPACIKRNEPISRGKGSKPHMCEEVYAIAGKKVYVHPEYAPNGVTEDELPSLKESIREKGASRMIDFQIRTRDAIVYARGHVRHPDHKKIILPCWHRVYMNTENRSKASRFSIFLD